MLFLLLVLAIVGCGLMAGLFFAFSVCVMRALSTLPPAQGIVAMQAINKVILNPIFFAVFMGTAVLCLYFLVSSLLNRSAPNANWLLLASTFYLVGVFGVTTIFNVPLNDALDKLNPNQADSAQFWTTYLTTWTLWNHVRTIASIGATIAFILAIVHRTP